MRLDTEDKKKPEKIKAELLEEFECGKQNRELAVTQLSERRRKPDESVQTYAFKIMELTKLAYPAFDDDSMKTIAKDHFVKGIHPKMQIALKASPKFASSDILNLAKETMRLEMAGIESFANKVVEKCCANQTDANQSTRQW